MYVQGSILKYPGISFFLSNLPAGFLCNSLVQNSNLVGAMAFVLEVSDEASLPENIMCSIELTNQNFDGKIRFVDETI